MRRLLVILGLVVGLAAPVFAQPEPEPTPSKMRQPEVLNQKPSGFRMSAAPAKGGAYRYRLLIPGAFCVLLTAGLVTRYLRKVSRSRSPAG